MVRLKSEPAVGVVTGEDEHHRWEDEGEEGDGAGADQVQDGPEPGDGLGDEEEQEHDASPEDTPLPVEI